MWFDVQYIKHSKVACGRAPHYTKTSIKLFDVSAPVRTSLRLPAPICTYLRLPAPINCLVYHVCLSLYMRLAVSICAYLCLSALIYTYLRLSAPLCA